MVSRSHDVTCLVPQERASLGLGGDGGTLTPGGSTVPIRDSACQDLGLVEGDRGDNNPDRPGKLFAALPTPRGDDDDNACSDGGGNPSVVVRGGGRAILSVGACPGIGELREDGRLSVAVDGDSRASDSSGARLLLAAAGDSGVVVAPGRAPSQLSGFLPLHFGPCEGTSRNDKLSWQRMHVTVRPASPCPIARASFLLLPVLCLPPSSSSSSAVFFLLAFVSSGGGGGPRASGTGSAVDTRASSSSSSGESAPSLSSAAACFIEQDFLCPSRLRTKTLAPHWKGQRTNRSSQACSRTARSRKRVVVAFVVSTSPYLPPQPSLEALRAKMLSEQRCS